MSTEKPYKLQDPERRRPLRSGFTAWRRSDRGAAAKPRSGGPLRSSEDVVLEAVKLGYKIADEQIQKGQDVARRLRGAALRSDAGDVGNLIDHGLRLARQLAVLLVEITETTAQAPAIAKAFAKAVNEGPGGGDATNEARARSSSAEPGPSSSSKLKSAAQTIPVRVKSQRATRVSLVLYELLTTCPEVYPLQLKGKKPGQLHEVLFEAVADDEGGGYVLTVEVPKAQAAGTYRGYAVNPADGKPLGFIEVTIEAK